MLPRAFVPCWRWSDAKEAKDLQGHAGDMRINSEPLHLVKMGHFTVEPTEHLG
jgi:hypothetical protein